MNIFKYSTYDCNALEQEFSTSLEQGLSEQQVHERRIQYGYNAVTESLPSWIHFVWQQIKSPFIVLLTLAAILSFFLDSSATGCMIFLIIFVNVVVGFYQEFKADRSIRLLKSMIPQVVVVRRDGVDRSIPSRDIIPGDVIYIETGMMIPADVRFIEAHDVTIEESILTGEPVPVRKRADEQIKSATTLSEAHNIGYAGTRVLTGRGRAVVITIGTHTIQGNVGTSAEQIVSESIFANDVSYFTKVLLSLITIFCALLVVAHLLKGGTQSDFFQILLFAIALAISITPEALPIIILFTLSRSARRLAQEKVVVKRLSAVNDLGSVQVLCVDKTGTLTENNMTVVEWIADNPEQLFLSAALATEQPHVPGRSAHSLDDALWKQVEHNLVEFKRYKKIKNIPFDPARRTNEVIVQGPHGELHIIRGAAEVIMHLCSVPVSDYKYRWAIEQGNLGRRVLAVAHNTTKEFMGLIAFSDPLKTTVKGSIRRAQDLQVQIKVITGDAAEVAGAVARDAGIITQTDTVMLGSEIDKLSGAQLDAVVETCHVFARVSPQQKYTIVKTLQKKYAVGFLGDGINDVLALKAAHVGIVVQGCADTAREAADIILLKKSLRSIVNGIRLGRISVANTKKYITTTLSSNIGNFFALAFSSLFIPFLPLQPVQILLLNFLSDFPMLALSTDNVDAHELRIPARFDMSWIVIMVMIFGCVGACYILVLFSFLKEEVPAVVQTYWFMGAIFMELALIFSLRTKRWALFGSRPAFWLIALASIELMLVFLIPITKIGQFFFSFTTPRVSWLMTLGGLTCAYFTNIEIVKHILYAKKESIKKLVHRYIS